MLLSPSLCILSKTKLLFDFKGLRLKNLLQIYAPTDTLDYRVFTELFLKWIEWVHENLAILILRWFVIKLDANFLFILSISATNNR